MDTYLFTYSEGKTYIDIFFFFLIKHNENQNKWLKAQPAYGSDTVTEVSM